MRRDDPVDENRRQRERDGIEEMGKRKRKETRGECSSGRFDSVG